MNGLDGLAELAFEMLPGIDTFVSVALALGLVVRASLQQLLLAAFTCHCCLSCLLLHRADCVCKLFDLLLVLVNFLAKL